MGTLFSILQRIIRVGNLRGIKSLLRRPVSSLDRNTKDYLAAYQRKNDLRRICYKSVLGSCITTLVCCFVFIVYKAAVDSELFHINEIIIENNEVTQNIEVLAAVKLAGFTSMLHPVNWKLRETLSQLPWVRDAKVRKVWPSTLEITIMEHVPLALINLAVDVEQVELHYVDENGEIFSQALGNYSLDYPVITGFVPINTEQTEDETNEPLQRALQFLKKSKFSSILSIQSISEIHISPDQELIVHLVKHPFPIYLGKENISHGFARLSSVLLHLEKKHKINNIEKITMDYLDRQVLVSMNEPIR